MLDLVTQYIQDNILHSKVFDNATPEQRNKAVNQAINTLLRYLPDVYRDRESIPVEDVAEQVLWLLKIDDSLQRAEMGATMITVDGISIQMREMDRTIAPTILNLYGIKDSRKRRVGSYSDSLGFRTGIGR
jgi:predicted AlkP superfamily phosphohydrolase/phosphomutase